MAGIPPGQGSAPAIQGRMFKNITYYGSVPMTVQTIPEELDLKEQCTALKNAFKPRKVALEVEVAGIRFVAKKQETLHQLPASLILWAKHDPKRQLIAVLDTYASPSLCHIFRTRDSETIFRYIMHRLGVHNRMIQRQRRASQPARRVSQVTPEVVPKVKDLPVSYEAWYLGSMMVPSSTGQEVVQNAYDFIKAKLKASGDVNVRGNNVAIIVSEEGVRTLDSLTRAAVNSIFVASITFVATIVDEELSQEILALISYDDRLDRCTTYLYVCVPMQAATLTQYIELALGKHHTEEETDNPFKAGPENPDLYNMEVDPQLLALSLSRVDLAPIKSLGPGKFGRVFLAAAADEVDEEGEQLQLAVQIIRPDSTLEDRQQLLHGYKIMLSFDHPHILKVLGVCLESDPWLFATEFKPFGKVSDVIKGCREKNVEVTEVELVAYASQVAQALEFITSKGFVHMDVCASNIMLSHGGLVKLTGFEMAQNVEPDTKLYTLTQKLKLSLRWLAVEAYTQSPPVFGQATDVWSFGMMFWEFFSGQVPYSSARLSQVHQQVPKGMRPERPEGCPDVCWKMITDCWNTEPENRPTFTDLVARLEAAKVPGAEPRDIGETLNSRLHGTLQTLTKFRKDRHRELCASQGSEGSFEYTAIFGGNRKNPLFGEDLSDIWEFDGVDEDAAEDDMDDDDDDTLSDVSSLSSSLSYRDKRPPSMKSGVFNPPSDMEIMPSDMHVVLMPGEDQGTASMRKRMQQERKHLMERNPSRAALAGNPHLFMPSE
eukprot:m.113522 g.113522  ORF g.113522 m.113522 type:complete len:772 (+) comp13520_c0_seq1:485-2800(+)